MNYGGEAADQVVRMTLNGVEVAARLSGKAVEKLAKMIYTIIKQEKRSTGKVRLTNLVKSGKRLKIFGIQDENVALFCREAKKYGVLYCVLKDNDANDGITDIMVKEDDGPKISRIVDRFNLATVDMAELKTEIEESRENRENSASEETEGHEPAEASMTEEPGKDHPEERSVPEKTEERSIPQPPPEEARTRSDRIDEFLEHISAGSSREASEEKTQNPSQARTESLSRSGRSSGNSKDSNGEKSHPGEERRSDSERKKPSVKEELQRFRDEMKKEPVLKPAEKENQHIAPKKKKGRKGRSHAR